MAQVEDFTYAMDYPSWVRMVDFAAENNIRYLVLDAKSGAWALLVSENGREWSPAKYPKVIKALPEWEDGSLCTGILGRPCLLIENGSPRFLYAAYTMEEQGRRSCNITIPLKEVK